jgi:hypothetical protein
MNVPFKLPSAKGTGNSNQNHATEELGELLGEFVESFAGLADSLGIIALYYERKGRLEGLLTDKDFEGGPTGEQSTK